jgi:hypothetical protein
MLRLDSGGQKGPEITLEGILILLEACFTAERTYESPIGHENDFSPILSPSPSPSPSPRPRSLVMLSRPAITLDLVHKLFDGYLL